MQVEPQVPLQPATESQMAWQLANGTGGTGVVVVVGADVGAGEGARVVDE